MVGGQPLSDNESDPLRGADRALRQLEAKCRTLSGGCRWSIGVASEFCSACPVPGEMRAESGVSTLTGTLQWQRQLVQQQV
jgi:hypothetical protein